MANLSNKLATAKITPYDIAVAAFKIAGHKKYKLYQMRNDWPEVVYVKRVGNTILIRNRIWNCKPVVIDVSLEEAELILHEINLKNLKKETLNNIEYKYFNCAQCPSCFSDNINLQHGANFDEDYCVKSSECLDCKATWSDYYQITEFIDLKQ